MIKVLNVFIGRFQPPHNAHIEIIRGALNAKWNEDRHETNPNHVLICIGSANQPRTPKNPFRTLEREAMITACFTAEERQRLHFAHINDSLYNNEQWARDIQQAVNELITPHTEVRLVGHKKDDSSFYLDMFPQWKFIGIRNIDDLHSTTIRDYYLNNRWDNGGVDVFKEMCEGNIPDQVFNTMMTFRERPEFQELRAEFSFIEQYKAAWANSPYPPVFVTCDAVVVQSGHIILVRRAAAPGRGLWALPGGFLDQNETIEDCVIRELREETKLKVPDPVLRGSIVNSKVFDHPQRSLRGRTVTHAHYIHLRPGPLPPIKGGDDAAEAKWVPLAEVLSKQNELFEDHASIIKYFVGDA